LLLARVCITLLHLWRRVGMRIVVYATNAKIGEGINN
jgi:hypothetical protein